MCATFGWLHTLLFPFPCRMCTTRLVAAYTIRQSILSQYTRLIDCSSISIIQSASSAPSIVQNPRPKNTSLGLSGDVCTTFGGCIHFSFYCVGQARGVCATCQCSCCIHFSDPVGREACARPLVGAYTSFPLSCRMCTARLVSSCAIASFSVLYANQFSRNTRVIPLSVFEILFLVIRRLIFVSYTGITQCLTDHFWSIQRLLAKPAKPDAEQSHFTGT